MSKSKNKRRGGSRKSTVPAKRKSESWRDYHDRLASLIVEANKAGDTARSRALQKRAGEVAREHEYVATRPRGGRSEGPGSYPWYECVKDQRKRGYDKEAANAICGRIRASSRKRYPAYWQARAGNPAEPPPVQIDVLKFSRAIPVRHDQILPGMVVELLEDIRDEEYERILDPGEVAVPAGHFVMIAPHTDEAYDWSTFSWRYDPRRGVIEDVLWEYPEWLLEKGRWRIYGTVDQATMAQLHDEATKRHMLVPPQDYQPEANPQGEPPFVGIGLDAGPRAPQRHLVAVFDRKGAVLDLVPIQGDLAPLDQRYPSLPVIGPLAVLASTVRMLEGARSAPTVIHRRSRR